MFSEHLVHVTFSDSLVIRTITKLVGAVWGTPNNLVSFTTFSSQYGDKEETVIRSPSDAPLYRKVTVLHRAVHFLIHQMAQMILLVADPVNG